MIGNGNGNEPLGMGANGCEKDSDFVHSAYLNNVNSNVDYRRKNNVEQAVHGLWRSAGAHWEEKMSAGMSEEMSGATCGTSLYCSGCDCATLVNILTHRDSFRSAKLKKTYVHAA